MNALNSNDKCGCQNHSGSSHILPLAMASIPMQTWEQPWEPCKALKCGTIFPSLNLPFYKTGGDCCD